MTSERNGYINRPVEKITLDGDLFKSMTTCSRDIAVYAQGYSDNVTALVNYLSKYPGLLQINTMDTLCDCLDCTPEDIRSYKSVANGTISIMNGNLETQNKLWIYSVYKRGMILLPLLESNQYYQIPSINTSLKVKSRIAVDEMNALRRINTFVKSPSDRNGSLKFCITPQQETVLSLMLCNESRSVTYGQVIRMVYGDVDDVIAESVEQYVNPDTKKKVFSNKETRYLIMNRTRSIVNKLKKGLSEIGIELSLEHQRARNLEDNTYRLVELKIADN